MQKERLKPPWTDGFQSETDSANLIPLASREEQNGTNFSLYIAQPCSHTTPATTPHHKVRVSLPVIVIRLGDGLHLFRSELGSPHLYGNNRGESTHNGPTTLSTVKQNKHTENLLYISPHSQHPTTYHTCGLAGGPGFGFSDAGFSLLRHTHSTPAWLTYASVSGFFNSKTGQDRHTPTAAHQKRIRAL